MDCSRYMWTMSGYKRERKYLCMTNRHLCEKNLTEKIRELAGNPEIEKIILREKDMKAAEYKKLAADCQAICCRTGKPLVINHFIQIARELGVPEIQISYSQLTETQEELEEFAEVGVSVHDPREARKAEDMGASFIIAGHIFPTDCKKGVPPRGLLYLKEVCRATSLPVYAIGGITPYNIESVLKAGAKGACMMSGFMK